MDTESEQPNELQTFLPKGEEAREDLLNHSTKVTVIPAKSKEKDYLNGHSDLSTSDPFKLRQVDNPTTDGETLTHLLKACLGSGILAMPYAFKNGGILFGAVVTIIIGIICAHCAYILVKSAHAIYYRIRAPALTYAEIGEATFKHGPNFFKKFAQPARLCIVVGLFLTYFGTCCAYNVIIAGNLEQVIKHYHYFKDVNKRWFILALLLPLILLSYVPNLKSLAICSQIANVLMGSTIGISLYYIFTGTPLKSPAELPTIAPIENLPEFFSIVIFAMECIGVIMPLENNMEKPKHILGKCGVMNKGMSTVTLIYFILGFIGYLKYGDKIEEVITLNLPVEEIGSQCAKVFVAFAVFFTYGLQFYVCLDIIWIAVKDRITKNSKMYNYLLRTILVILSVIVAIAVPEISPFLTIIGALFFSALGIVFPAVIELLVFWDDGFGYCYWKLVKTIFLIFFGVLAMIFGTHSGIKGVIKSYSK
ncbi:hypothetical protein V9T40_014449 [Parthenolecanium corni]|uniref:Amino acid transporter transmembrane domain-containing protein n=1 Tax=Parthenolecanium corni TaxID=536013 RepID=A0AAN9XX12_9HEMI